jgi:hypothetical protein
MQQKGVIDLNNETYNDVVGDETKDVMVEFVDPKVLFLMVPLTP